MGTNPSVANFTGTVEREDVGKVIIIQGASQGLGKELAYRYARRDARLVLTSRDEQLLKKVAAEIKLKTGNKDVEVCAGDSTNINQCADVIDFTIAKYGRID